MHGMARFFVSPEELSGSFLTLTGENAAHCKVLRIKRGDTITLCDGGGHECQCAVSDISPGQVSLVVTGRETSQTEARLMVRIYMAFPKSDKLEHVIQKATELGACEIIGFPSARCVSLPDAKSLERKLDRWRKIASSAAEQSGRGRIPTVRVLPSFQEAVADAAQAELSIIFYENEHQRTLSSLLKQAELLQSVSILTGPEGGLTPQEVQQARDAGLYSCSLGRRILRCETAPLCALSAILYAAGEF